MIVAADFRRSPDHGTKRRRSESDVKYSNMNTRKPTKRFGFGFAQAGSSNRSSVFDEEERVRHKPPTLDDSSDDDRTLFKRRKLVTLDDGDDDALGATLPHNRNNDSVKDLDDDLSFRLRASAG
jgi:hypothetical protein